MWCKLLSAVCTSYCFEHEIGFVTLFIPSSLWMLFLFWCSGLFLWSVISMVKHALNEITYGLHFLPSLVSAVCNSWIWWRFSLGMLFLWLHMDVCFWNVQHCIFAILLYAILVLVVFWDEACSYLFGHEIDTLVHPWSLCLLVDLMKYPPRNVICRVILFWYLMLFAVLFAVLSVGEKYFKQCYLLW